MSTDKKKEEKAIEAVKLVTMAVNEPDLAGKKFGLVFVGNVFKCEKYFKSVMMKNLKFIKINFIPPTKKPIESTIKLALENQ